MNSISDANFICFNACVLPALMGHFMEKEVKLQSVELKERVLAGNAVIRC